MDRKRRSTGLRLWPDGIIFSFLSILIGCLFIFDSLDKPPKKASINKKQDDIIFYCNEDIDLDLGYLKTLSRLKEKTGKLQESLERAKTDLVKLYNQVGSCILLDNSDSSLLVLCDNYNNEQKEIFTYIFKLEELILKVNRHEADEMFGYKSQQRFYKFLKIFAEAGNLSRDYDAWLKELISEKVDLQIKTDTANQIIVDTDKMINKIQDFYDKGNEDLFDWARRELVSLDR